ncbi:MAG: ATP synthase F1 subunit delta [bacterium]|nr:ATP synthase F1 subunit delta [bacterium]
MTETLKNKNNEAISKKWAKALMELVLENNEVSDNFVLNDLRSISDTINSSEELLSVINNPSISTEEKQIVLCKLFQDKVNPLVYSFLFTLNLRKRTNLIGDITVEYEKELDRINNTKHINVLSAIELSQEKKDDIKGKISAKLNADIDIEWGVDTDIIAGLIFNIDETVIDNSVRHKLEDLSKIIMKG